MKTLKEFLEESAQVSESLWSSDAEGLRRYWAQRKASKKGKSEVEASKKEKAREAEEIANAGPSERDLKDMAGSGERELKPEFRGPRKKLIKYLEPGKLATRRKR